MTRDLLDDMVQIERTLARGLADSASLSLAATLCLDRARQAIQRHHTQETTEMTDSEEWIKWAGGERPVDGSTVVETKNALGDRVSGPAGSFAWNHLSEFGTDYNITAYRVLSRVPKPEQRKTYWALNGEVIFDAGEVTKDEALSFADGGPIERVEVVETIQPAPVVKEWALYWTEGLNAIRERYRASDTNRIIITETDGVKSIRMESL
jgi:hypothetical protein